MSVYLNIYVCCFLKFSKKQTYTLCDKSLFTSGTVTKAASGFFSYQCTTNFAFISKALSGVLITLVAFSTAVAESLPTISVTFTKPEVVLYFH